MKQQLSKTDSKELNNLAIFTHGTLFALHSLGMVYNLKKRNYMAACIHGATGAWDFVCGIAHVNEGQDLEE
jgi:hypothetical protein